MALPKKELTPLDFRSTERTWIKYSNQDPRSLPSGTITDFKWKNYCPAVFRHLQELENIDYGDYMRSVCGHETLREVSSPGKSGSLFYLSKDDRFVIKTLRKNEVKVLLEMLPNYYRHVRKYGASLLTKFYGLHVVRPVGGLKVYFVVMENIFRSDLYIHKRYDLKGSSQGRTVNKFGVDEKTTFKDLDLDFQFYLNPLLQRRLLAQIKYDCEFLEAEGIMDYSLLLGVHIEAPHRGSFNGRSFSTRRTVPHNPLQRHEDIELTLADICQQPDRPGFKFGVKMPARAIKTPRSEMGSASFRRRVGAREPYNVCLYFGIIDILQGYNVLKRIEHAYKSLQYDSKSISAVNPTAYSARFQDFMCKVFQAEDSDY
ncbi:hypothetical protein L1049_013203 [Liquidambar formosana]|uniref:1-phosphatidylinositol-4-phosphate 5-kinase n=1 Tax=Liquidambar formosana TaxID=63359 RepID=A0AAP0RK87_LIQFO